jgi:hypothetical protein
MKREKTNQKRQKKGTHTKKWICLFPFSLYNPILYNSPEENNYVPGHDMENSDERTLTEDLTSPIRKKRGAAGIQ